MHEEQETVPNHVSDNIEAVLAMRAKSERRLRRDQRAVEALTDFIGRPRTLYVLLAGVAVWVSYNRWLAVSGAPVFDPPPFFWLQGLMALYASVMTTIVLTTQRRQNKETAHYEHFELQVNLLAEQRTAKIIALLEELRRDLPNVRDRVDPVAEALQEVVAPGAVDSAIDQSMNVSVHESASAQREPTPPTGT